MIRKIASFFVAIWFFVGEWWIFGDLYDYVVVCLYDQVMVFCVIYMTKLGWFISLFGRLTAKSFD